MLVSVDPSLRSSGVCAFSSDGQLVDFTVIRSDGLTAEDTLIHNGNRFIEFCDSLPYAPTKMVFEGLSFGAKSGEKDILWGNFWYLRCLAKIRYGVPTDIYQVSAWRSPLFTKADRLALKESAKKLAEQKVPLKGLKGEIRKETIENNRVLELAASIKEATYVKLPESISMLFEDRIRNVGLPEPSKYDLADAFFIGRHAFNSL